MPAVPVLQWLSLAGVGTTLQTLNWATTQAMGRPGVMLRFRLFSTPVTLLGFVIGLHWGVVGVAASFAITRFIFAPIQTYITCRTLGCSPGLCEAKRWSYVSRWSWPPLWPWRDSGSCMPVSQPRLDSQ